MADPDEKSRKEFDEAHRSITEQHALIEKRNKWPPQQNERELEETRSASLPPDKLELTVDA